MILLIITLTLYTFGRKERRIIRNTIFCVIRWLPCFQIMSKMAFTVFVTTLSHVDKTLKYTGWSDKNETAYLPHYVDTVAEVPSSEEKEMIPR